jgi:2-polyprenyl-3-methyl-5-hydroxy-6-metoxy-1,4-benzoquinol methylase
LSLADFYRVKEHAAYFSTVRSEIAPYLPLRPSRVLDIGCGDGATLLWLKSQGLADWTCGVDINAEVLERARAGGVDLVVQGALDELALPIAPESIDVILCLDVLEHLADPWTVAQGLTRLLRAGGVLIASIPNVQSLRVIAPLLAGRWTYRDCGILDQGHLRFFTRRSAMALLQQAALRITAVRPILERHWLPRYANHLTLHVFQRYVTERFLLRAVK